MKEILSRPGIQHKFVKGLASRPGRRIYRKSGTWRNWHCDAALIEAGSKKYVAVALMEDSRGGKALPELIRKIDDLICDGKWPALRAHLIARPGLN
jgi:beta-lactamase class A